MKKKTQIAGTSSGKIPEHFLLRCRAGNTPQFELIGSGLVGGKGRRFYSIPKKRISRMNRKLEALNSKS